MKELFLEYRYIIVFLVVVVIYALFEWQRTKATLYGLMLQAKRMAKDYILKSGQEQEEWVVNKAMIFLPVPIRVILNEDIVRRIIKWLFHNLKDYADNENLDDSYK